MKTTIDLSDALLHEAKASARAHGVTLRALIEQGLHMAIKQMQTKKKPYALRDCSVGGAGLQAGQSSDWVTVRDMVYEGHGA